MTDRLRCINPACRRTAPKPNFPWATEIVCSKCWRLVPERLKHGYRYYRRERRRWEKMILQYGEQRWMDWDNLARYQALNWSKIRDFFAVKPEFPAGLDGFLKEVFNEGRGTAFHAGRDEENGDGDEDDDH